VRSVRAWCEPRRLVCLHKQMEMIGFNAIAANHRGKIDALHATSSLTRAGCPYDSE